MLTNTKDGEQWVPVPGERVGSVPLGHKGNIVSVDERYGGRLGIRWDCSPFSQEETLRHPAMLSWFSLVYDVVLYDIRKVSYLGENWTCRGTHKI